jgi:hypothetical protein
MVKGKRKLSITRLKKEIEVKDFIIKELLRVVTENKIKLPEILAKSLILLYTGVPTDGRKEKAD